MWFKNLQLYRLAKDKPLADSAAFESALTGFVLSPCSACDPQSLGWVAPTETGALLHSVNRQWLLALGVEKRLLPASVVKQFANDRAKQIEEAEGRRVGRKEMRDLREALQAYAGAVTSPFGLCVVRLGEELLAAPRRVRSQQKAFAKTGGVHAAALLVISRGFLGVGGPRLAGFISGSQTQPAILAFAN